jgi:CRISPR-associated endonuclease Cas1
MDDAARIDSQFEDAEGFDWASRCRYWIERSSSERPRRRREREPNPLVLNGHGLSIRVHRGTLVIRDGNTHYPAEQREWRFFNGSLDIPPVIVAIDGSGEITLDAIDWLTTQGVPLIRLRWNGQFMSLVTAGGQAASAENLRWQDETRQDPERRWSFSHDLIRRKVRSTLRTMEDYVPRSGVWETGYESVQAMLEQIEQDPPRDLTALLGLEGAAAKSYFRAWSGIKLRWSKNKKYPIPDEWIRFRTRSALRVGKIKNLKATHPINAMLNYAYGVAVAREHINVISEGYDPTIGVMHDLQDKRGYYPAFVLDRIEPLRPLVDRAVLRIITSEMLTSADFAVQDDGVCRLNPELARRLAQSAFEHYAAASDSGWLGLGEQQRVSSS